MRQPPVSYTLEDQERMTMAKNYFAWQSRLVLGEIGRRVVEIGCGVGNFTEKLLSRELVVALDIEPDCVERLQERYRGRDNLRALVCDAGSADFRRLASYDLDSCVCLNVLEHIEDDLGALAAMQAILRPRGVAVLIVPAFPSLYGPIDRNLGHWRRYTRTAIGRTAIQSGFRIRKIRYMNSLGFFGWWVNAHILKREAQSEQQIRFFDRYLVPAMSAAEAALPPVFGQSLMVVLEKP